LTTGEDLLPPGDSTARCRQAMPRAYLHRELLPPLGPLLTRRAASSRRLASCLPAALRANAAAWPPTVSRHPLPTDPPQGGLRSRHPQGQRYQMRWRRAELVFCGSGCAKRL
jgi:hypothetical protein